MEFRFVKGYKKTAITYLPKKVFDDQFKRLSKEILNDRGGIEEGKIFVAEMKYRDNFDELFLKYLFICDYEEISTNVTEWLIKGIRPEQINLALIIHFNTYIDELNLNKYYSEKELSELLKNCNNHIREFNEMCAEEYNCNYNYYSYIEEQYAKFKPTGLGFDLITNSASNALLFQAWNSKEIDKQIGQNARAKRYAISQLADKKASEKMSKISQMYNTFAQTILLDLDDSINLLNKMKQKCTKVDQKDEEIKKQKRRQKNEEIKLQLLKELKKADLIYKNILKDSQPEQLKKAREFAKRLWIFVIIFLIFLWIFVFRRI